MSSNISSEQAARRQILDLVADYARTYHNQEKPFEEGDRIAYAARVYDEKEMVNLADAMLDFWLTSGKYTKEFEKRFGEYLGVRYVSVVNSGSSANLLAFFALTSPLLGERRIRRGNEVITVAAGFPTTVSPILQYGAVPVFCDVTIPGYNLDVTQLEEAVSEKTKAVFIAHTLGNPFDVKTIREFCLKHNLWLVEDNCDALGSSYTLDGKTAFCGSFGDIGTSSFYPPHHLTMGEGGAVYTSDPLLHKIIRSFRDWGRDCVCASGQDNLCGHRFDGQYGELPKGYDHKYVYSHLGFNLKATDLQAAIGCAQIDKLPAFSERRKHNFLFLKEKLVSEGGEEYLILPEKTPGSDPSWFGFLMTLRKTGIREQVVRYIESRGVQTRMLFSGNLIRHPCFDELRAEAGSDRPPYRVIGDLPNTDRIMTDAFWVGVYPGMTDEKLAYMAKVILEAVRRCVF